MILSATIVVVVTFVADKFATVAVEVANVPEDKLPATIPEPAETVPVTLRDAALTVVANTFEIVAPTT